MLLSGKTRKEMYSRDILIITIYCFENFEISKELQSVKNAAVLIEYYTDLFVD